MDIKLVQLQSHGDDRGSLVALEEEKNNSVNGLLYFTVGTQQIDKEGNFFIDDTIVKQSYNRSITMDLASRGIVMILEGDALEEYKADDFAYINESGASTASIRKVKEQQATIAEMAKKLAAFEKAGVTKTPKPKGGNNG